MLVYLDTNIVVYMVESPPDLGPRAVALVGGLVAQGHRLAISHLVRLECRVKPLASGDERTLADYGALFARAGLATLEVTGEAFDLAAGFRARHRLRTMDALHLAAAIVGGCGAFLTNDVRLSAFPHIPMMMLAPS
jgi:predicted nucleic acid-binding protein